MQLIGLPEGRLNLAQATIALALAPKSNAVINGDRRRQRRRARRQDRAGARAPARRALRAARRSSGTARATATRTTSPFGVAEQQYAPDVVAGRRRTTEPTRLGAEAAVKERWERIRAMVRGRRE